MGCGNSRRVVHLYLIANTKKLLTNCKLVCRVRLNYSFWLKILFIHEVLMDIILKTNNKGSGTVFATHSLTHSLTQIIPYKDSSGSNNQGIFLLIRKMPFCYLFDAGKEAQTSRR